MRLTPRFSLRFLLLAVTIFVMVFGVGVKYWRAYQEHERVASQLVTLGNNVEEEFDTSFGYVTSKRITSLQLYAYDTTSEHVDLLDEFPEPWALRRLYVRATVFDEADPFAPPAKPDYQALARLLARTPNLEVLGLTFRFDAELVRAIQGLKNLRELTLEGCQFTEAELGQILSSLPQLEMLFIHMPGNDLAIDCVLQADLPRLRALGISSQPELSQGKLGCDRACFQRTGLGRFPQLEYLTLTDIDFQDSGCEADALPALKILELVRCQFAAKKPPPGLFATAPQLQALTIDLEQLEPQVIAELNAAPALQDLCLYRLEQDIVALQALREKGQIPSGWPPERWEKFTAVLSGCPGLKIYSDYNKFLTASKLPNFLVNIPSWSSDHWRGQQ